MDGAPEDVGGWGEIPDAVRDDEIATALPDGKRIHRCQHEPGAFLDVGASGTFERGMNHRQGEVEANDIPPVQRQRDCIPTRTAPDIHGAAATAAMQFPLPDADQSGVGSSRRETGDRLAAAPGGAC